VRGILEIAQRPDGKLLARRFTQRGLEWGDELPVNQSQPAFMSMTFRVATHLPHAVAAGDYERLDLPPSKPGIPAARLRVSVGERQADLWLARDGLPRRVELGDDLNLTVAYGVDHLPLPFRVHVDRFERGVDPGTDNAASFASQVRVLDERDQPIGEPARIAMNEPLRHGGLTFYQSGFQKLPNGRTVTILAVNRDPGRVIKYAGSLLIVLGIFTMFYMRAYFFQARTTSADEPATKAKPGKPAGPAVTLILLAALLAVESVAHADTAEAAVHDNTRKLPIEVNDADHEHEHGLAVVPHAPRLGQAALDALRRIPVMHDGRVKPLDTVATQMVRQVTGRSRFGAPVDRLGELVVEQRYDPVELMLAWMSDPPAWSNVPQVQVQRLELREFLGMPATHTHIAAATLSKHEKFVALSRELFAKAARAEMDGEPFEPTPFEDAVLDVARREGHFRAACQGTILGLLPWPRDPAFFSWLAEQDQSEQMPGAVARTAVTHWRAIDAELDASRRPEAFAHRAGWLSLGDLLATDPRALPPVSAARWTQAGRLWAAALHAYRQAEKPDAAMVELATQLPQVSEATAPARDMDREVTYNRVHPFRWAMAFYLLAAMVLTVATQVRTKSVYAIGLGVLTAAAAVHIWGFYLRVVISGWAPVTNMYETVIWVALLCAVFGLALESVYRWRVIALSAAVVAAVCTLVADIMPPNLGAEIRSLQPVLRSNFWLTTHVLTIVSSYAAFALALGLANVALGFYLWAPRHREAIRRLTLFIYRAMQIGVLLIAAGTILGGVWADQSWGRFWGWDPKEVWALIVLLIYLAILHGRFAGWIGPFGLAAGAVMGFTSVIMAWYGVNFVLGVGLHSYGFGAGGRAEVFAGVAVQLLYLAAAWWRHRSVMLAQQSHAIEQQVPATHV
jgi:ABC-type transport system involved in cytochrome c biogenesis permease subunit